MRPRAEGKVSRRAAERAGRARGVAGFVAAVLVLAILFQAAPAGAVYECGGEYDTCTCGRANYCLCDGTCGNCVWHAWHSACCHLTCARVAPTPTHLERQRGEPRLSHGTTPQNSSIFVREASTTCSGQGHGMGGDRARRRQPTRPEQSWADRAARTAARARPASPRAASSTTRTARPRRRPTTTPISSRRRSPTARTSAPASRSSSGGRCATRATPPGPAATTTCGPSTATSASARRNRRCCPTARTSPPERTATGTCR